MGDCKYLDLSIRHLPPGEILALNDNDYVHVIEYPEGVWVEVSPMDHPNLQEIKNLRSTGFPHLAAAILLARRRGCDWINFSYRGETEENLSLFNTKEVHLVH